MKFSEYYNLNKTQFELNFVNIYINKDTNVAIDPWAIRQGNDEFSVDCFKYISSFFEQLLKKIENKDEFGAKDLLKFTHEVKEIRFGNSIDSYNGLGMDRYQSNKIYEAIKGSKAVETGLLKNIEDCALMIENINKDKISDMIANIIKYPLIKYTQRQCELHNIKMEKEKTGFYWDIDKNDWINGDERFPVPDHSDIKFRVILVPKYFVRQNAILNHHDFYRNELLNFEQARYSHGGVALAKALKYEKTKKITKKELKKVIPSKKEDVFKFLKEHPQYLDLYKKRKTKKFKELEDETILKVQKSEETDKKNRADELIEKLKELRPGKEDAYKYHDLIKGILEFIFSPWIVNPTKEDPLTKDGIKRVDITFFNNAKEGFFADIVRKGIISYKIYFECKNYNDDPKNEEFDQLSGRLGSRTGKIGFLVCRKVDDKETALKRCKLALTNKEEYLIYLDDEDIMSLLDYKKLGLHADINIFLHSKLSQLSDL